MELLKQYQVLEKEILEYFGYQEQWRVLPLHDSTDMYWMVDRNGVHFGEEYADCAYGAAESESDKAFMFSNELCGKVCRGKDYTAVPVYTNCDGNMFLQIFDNAKEVTPDED